MISKTELNGIDILMIESKSLAVSIVPSLGGKILRLYNKKLSKDFLWTNQNLPLQKQETGADYDSNFIGAIDELIPNDISETIDGIDYPDHGELWTTALQYEQTKDTIIVHGSLPLSGLYYSKTLFLDAEAPVLHLQYLIKNETNELRHFLWKLHAALTIEAGDKLVTDAKWGQVVDPAYSRFADTTPFQWPVIENVDAAIVPPKTSAVDFFYLYDTPKGEMSLVNKNDTALFCYSYDKNVFPYQWYFASYGGFLNHYTAILEPCTNMPLSVNEAIQKGQCAVLQPGESLQTSIQIYAGENK